MKYEIKNRFTGDVQFTADIDCNEDDSRFIKIGLSVKWGIKNHAYLEGADLEGADLEGAYLRDANLRDADLRDANLEGAYLRDANLRDADLRDADLRDANLRDAYLRGANLRGANLRDANLRGANLRGANLRGAYLRDAYLRGADLRGADLRGAYLRGAYLRGADWMPKIKNIHQSILDVTSKEGALNMESWHTCETTHCRAGWVIMLAGEGGKVLEGIYGTSVAAAFIYQNSDPSLEKIPNWIDSNENAMEDMKRCADLEAKE